MRVICISRALAAGGEIVGHLVSTRLGFRYVDEEILSLAADKAQVDPSMVARVEHRQSILDRLMDAVAERGAVELPSYFEAIPEVGLYYPRATGVPAPKTREELRTLIREAIVEVASRGNVVIVAHAASYALTGRDGVLRVLVTASEKTRIERFWLDGKLLSESDAAAAVKESDRERHEYLRSFYGVREEQPTDYDLVINTDVLEPEQAAASICAAAGASG
jgi:hypothetical protein